MDIANFELNAKVTTESVSVLFHALYDMKIFHGGVT